MGKAAWRSIVVKIVGADGKVESDQQYRGFRW